MDSLCLDNKKAIDILNSNSKVEVLYQYCPVWIDKVEGNNAQVHCVDGGFQGQVPLALLVKKA